MTKISKVKSHPRKGTKGVTAHTRELESKSVPHSTGKVKYLAIEKGRRKAKSVGNKVMEEYMNHDPALINKVWSKVYSYPSSWSAKDARRYLKMNHPNIRLVAGSQASSASLPRLPKMRNRIKEVHNKYPPSMYRVTVIDVHHNRYKMDYDNKLRKITSAGLTEMNPTSLQKLSSRGKVKVQVQSWDDSDFSRGKNIRGIGRTILTEEF